jgi:hypothetical protein
MKIKMRTAMAHPTYGVAQSGQVVELPEAVARDMVAGGYAELIIDRRKETAAMAGAPERGMQMRPDPRDRKPLPAAAKEPEAKK